MRFGLAAVLFYSLLTAGAFAATPVDVTTYHNDNLRTGWNAAETLLTTANVSSTAFGLRRTFKVDGLMYAQPLIVTKERIGKLTHNMLIEATNADTLWAFDTTTGKLLWRHSFVNPKQGVTTVPLSFTGCPFTGSQTGITSTPVIDRSADAIYLVAATFEGSGSNQHIHQRLHAVSLKNGRDVLSPVELGGSFNGPQGTVTYDPDVQLQRSALLEANGNIYILESSYCDGNGDKYHGWVFAYSSSSLKQTAILCVTPSYDSSEGGYLGGIWMSGYGPGADANGNIFFAIGNGSFDGGSNNFGESALRVPPNLALNGSPPYSFFAPSTAYQDNANDADFGSGGLMLLPDQPGPVTRMAVGQGKDGVLTLMNRDSLGGFVNGGPDNVLAEVTLGGVWSGPGYWQDPNGNAYVLTTGGPLYRVQVTSNSLTVVDQTSVYFPSSNGNGSTPSVSSNANAAGSAIAWIVQRPSSQGGTQYLYAFDASNLTSQLFVKSLGNWDPNATNPTPVVTIANGDVYVPGTTSIYVFGLKKAGEQFTAPEGRSDLVSRPLGQHVLYGIIKGIRHDDLIVMTRSGRFLSVDIGPARARGRTGVLYLKRPVALYGTYDARRVYHVDSIVTAYVLLHGFAAWPPDR